MKTVWNQEIRKTMNHTLAFMKKIKAVEGMKIRIAASSLYRLFMDGQLVGYGPARAAHGYCRVDEYDLGSYAGQKMVIVIEVFASNVDSYYVLDEPPFLGVEIAVKDKVLADISGFKAFLVNDRVTKMQRFSRQRTFAESYEMVKCRQYFYKGDESVFPEIEVCEVESNKLISRGVNYPLLQDFPAKQCVEHGAVAYDPSGLKWDHSCLLRAGTKQGVKGYRKEELQECLTDEVAVFCYRRHVNKFAGKLYENTYVQYDFGHTVTGFVHLKLSVQEDAVVYIVFDEIITAMEDHNQIDPIRNNCCNVIKYKMKAGVYDLLGFEADSMRYVNVVVTKGRIALDSISMVLYENPDADYFVFDAGDEELNAIVEASRHTFAQNAVDILTDCPSRERAGWLCDSYFSSRAEYLFTGKNLVEHNFLENYIMAPEIECLPKGMLPKCYPSDVDGGFIPNWAMWFVLELKNYYDRTGDCDLIKAAKGKIYDLLSYFSTLCNEDGLLEDLQSWVFVEWSKCNEKEHICGVNYPSNMLYSKVLWAVSEMYGDEKLRAQSQAMKKVILSQSYNGEFFEDNCVREGGKLVRKGHLTETCQYYAFYFDVASRYEYPELYRIMMEKFGPTRDIDTVYPDVAPSNAIVGNYLRLELLLKDREYEQVLKECKEFFYKMAKLTGTLWEHNQAHKSLNHGFASVAANYIVECCENIGH